MTAYELKHETEIFQLGYWDAFSGTDHFPPSPSPSQRIEYHRGYRVGIDDFKRGN